MPRSVCIVPRWSGTPSSDWYPWLARSLRGEVGARVLRPDMPTPDHPVAGNWVAAVDLTLRTQRRHDLVLVGHSVGCQALLRWLAQQPEGEGVYATVLVAPWWTVDEPWPEIEPWLEMPAALDRARANAGAVTALLSTDDPFTLDYKQNERLWRERMGADVRVLEGRAHFNRPVEPDVLETVTPLLADD